MTLVYLFSGVPEPPRLCELRNDSSLEVVCQPGNDGGLQQHFVLEAVISEYFNTVESTRSPQNTVDNEISTMNDQVRIFFLEFLKGNVKVFKADVKAQQLSKDIVHTSSLHV